MSSKRLHRSCRKCAESPLSACTLSTRHKISTTFISKALLSLRFIISQCSSLKYRNVDFINFNTKNLAAIKACDKHNKRRRRKNSIDRRWQCSIIRCTKTQICAECLHIFLILYMLARFGFSIFHFFVTTYSSNAVVNPKKWFPVCLRPVALACIHILVYVHILYLYSRVLNLASLRIFAQLICKHLIIIFDRISAITTRWKG